MKIDWKRKLGSRKFWVAAIGIVTPLLLAFGVAQETVTQIAGLILSGATVIAYILGEGLVDANHVDAQQDAGTGEDTEDPTE